MDWIDIPNDDRPRDFLPLDGSTFLALWKGQFCLTCFDEDEDHFYLQMLPGVYAGDMKVAHEREGKFTHYCLLEYPKNY